VYVRCSIVWVTTVRAAREQDLLEVDKCKCDHMQTQRLAAEGEGSDLKQKCTSERIEPFAQGRARHELWLTGRWVVEGGSERVIGTIVLIPQNSIQTSLRTVDVETDCKTACLERWFFD